MTVKQIARGVVLHPGDVKTNWGFVSTRVINGVHQVKMIPSAGLALLIEDLYGHDLVHYEIVGRGATAEDAVENVMHKATFKQHEIALKAAQKYGS